MPRKDSDNTNKGERAIAKFPTFLHDQ